MDFFCYCSFLLIRWEKSNQCKKIYLVFLWRNKIIHEHAFWVNLVHGHWKLMILQKTWFIFQKVCSWENTSRKAFSKRIVWLAIKFHESRTSLLDLILTACGSSFFLVGNDSQWTFGNSCVLKTVFQAFWRALSWSMMIKTMWVMFD